MQSVFFDNIFDWMGFNLFLAFVPLVISFIVFNKGLWEGNLIVKPFLYILTAVFFLFLPNAPYTISDIIHLVRQIKEYRYFKIDDVFITTVLIPQFMVFIFLGFSCYVISFQKFLFFLNESGVKHKNIVFIKVIVPLFMSVGIFLGRVYRYSTWDIVTHILLIVKVIINESLNLSFYIYIVYYYTIILIGFEFFTLIYRSIFKKLFDTSI
ncbi:MAG: hypothetical protein A2015_14320 [Spirochaetes bacterium GWF1_31_7]|nr:MAG: hypothetical protein A2Y30_03430 [Spirochaetes bacterium GWE1_32_154]OHD45453.1 MAG: hypothetical protein A2Y29_01390 [Spirochaetes bacterium GWE2_31_10]OHD50576.1 MAG: hypothetical protein A2015_14320 [Spirochaetes bacterium GWF1_31_7]OHD81554.1 MAG: hypothetical protein A2355_02390 [Spirochaetes bacterium RIFOXYB1_FULL_32_8]HBD94570.1 hypothetical protein [Spirochaetia bacterium]